MDSILTDVALPLLFLSALIYLLNRIFRLLRTALRAFFAPSQRDLICKNTVLTVIDEQPDTEANKDKS